MNRTYFFIVLCLSFSKQLIAQRYSDTINHEEKYPGAYSKKYSLGSNQYIYLCSWDSAKATTKEFNGFSLYTQLQGNSFISWDEANTCKVYQHGDTLFVEELAYLPIGHNMSYINAPLFINKFFYKNEKLIRQISYNKSLHHYNRKEINLSLRKFSVLQKGNYESTVNVGDMLFWSWVSGNLQAEKDLLQLENKYGPFDGAVAEIWNTLLDKYNYYRKIEDAKNKLTKTIL